jgi:threonine synthase
MQYISTRGGTEPVGFSKAVAMGLAPDGGLFLPQTLPDLRPHLASWQGLDYPSLCLRFMEIFATDMDQGILAQCVKDSYAGFDHPDIAPIRSLTGTLHVCELFHGPTLAFKDFALQLLGRIYAAQISEHGQSLTVLGATSGDTGSAAIHGLMNLPGIRIFILYPTGGVAPLQERQMACTGSPSVFPIAIKGSFDDAQRVVKSLFSDHGFSAGCNLSAINSINLARVLAQCVYYLYAWFRIPEAQRADLQIVVPTGNFGNVLAGWLLNQMGMPLHAFKIATNRNDILYRLFQTGIYEQGSVDASLAPSMDIQVASNFERFLYYFLGQDSRNVRTLMESFLSTGRCVFENFNPGIFTAVRSDDSRIVANIREVHRRFNYVVDPHTACGFTDLDESRPNLIMATAHPAKFPDAIHEAIGIRVTHPSLDALKSKVIIRHELPATPSAIAEFIHLH